MVYIRCSLSAQWGLSLFFNFSSSNQKSENLPFNMVIRLAPDSLLSTSLTLPDPSSLGYHLFRFITVEVLMIPFLLGKWK